MGPESDIIIACPYCRKHLLVSGYACDVIVRLVRWSDGFVDTNGASPDVSSTCCVHCRKFFWLDTAEEVGTQEWFSETDIPYAVPLTQEQFEAVIAQRRWRNEDEELRTRLKFRWRENHGARELGFTIEPSELMQANLRRIAQIYSQRKARVDLLLAEVKWHLGEFDQALELLEGIKEPEQEQAVAKMKEVISMKKIRVMELQTHF